MTLADEDGVVAVLVSGHHLAVEERQAPFDHRRSQLAENELYGRVPGPLTFVQGVIPGSFLMVAAQNADGVPPATADVSIGAPRPR